MGPGDSSRSGAANDVPPFSPGEEKLLADLSAPVAEGFRRAVLMRDELPEDPLEAPGLLMFDERGVLESLNEQAEAWLQELEPTAAFGPWADDALPTEVFTVSARARAIAAGLDSGLARARLRTRSGRWLVIQGFCLRGTEGQEGRTALVIGPARAAQVAPLIVEAYQLTAREQEITRLVSYGLSTREIAARLHLSPHTVRDYLKQVFEKVGVSSRGELVAKIFAEHYAPPLDAGLVHAGFDPQDGANAYFGGSRRSARPLADAPPSAN